MNERQYRRYLNPYDFVPLEGTPSRAEHPNHALLRGKSGSIDFTLHLQSPLFVNQDPGRPNQRRVYAFAHSGTQPVLAATSIKGMLRSIHEVVTNSVYGILKDDSRDDRYIRRIPRLYRPSQRKDVLTPTEALFGMVGGRGEGASGIGGRVLIDDIVIASPLDDIEIWRPARGGMPKPDHASFYYTPNGEPLGRKFYYHQDYQQVRLIYSGQRQRASESRQIEAVPAGTRLMGTLRFFNLNDAELDALVYSLVLENGLSHKLGYGKPLGLGSLYIRIARLMIEQEEGGVPSRFLHYGTPTQTDRTGDVEAMRDRARTAWLGRPRGAGSHAAFTTIMRWQTQHLYIYPDYRFFQEERNQASKTPLWEYQERESFHPGPATNAGNAEPAANPLVGANAVATPAVEPPVEPAVEAPVAPAVVSSPLPAGPPIDMRFVARVLTRGSDPNIEMIVEGIDGKRYLILPDSAPREVIRTLLERVRANDAPRVRYRPERRKVQGKQTNIAVDVEIVEEGGR